MVIDKAVDEVLREVCLEVEERDQVKFLEGGGADGDPVHFLVSVSTHLQRDEASDKDKELDG